MLSVKFISGCGCAWRLIPDTLQAYGLKDRAALVLDAGTGDGTFLVCTHSDGSMVLVVVYKGRATHHRVSCDDGVMLVQNKRIGERTATLEDLVEVLRHRGVTGWPVPLRFPVADARADAAVATAESSTERVSVTGGVAAAGAATVLAKGWEEHHDDSSGTVPPALLLCVRHLHQPTQFIVYRVCVSVCENQNECGGVARWHEGA